MRDRSRIVKGNLRPFSPIIPPRPMLPKRGKRMTIGVGFFCKEGVVIGADAQESYGGDHLAYVEKVETFQTQYCSAVVAGASITYFIRHAIKNIFGIIAKPTSSDVMELRMEIDDAMQTLYKQEFKTYPCKKEDKSIQLLVGVKYGSDPPCLLSIESNLVNVVFDTYVIGYGAILQEHASDMRKMFSDMTLRQATLVASYLIYEAKRRFQRVGGPEATIVSIQRDGRLLHERKADQPRKEQTFTCLRRATYLQLLAMDTTLSDEKARELLLKAGGMIIRGRNERKKIEEDYEKMLQPPAKPSSNEP